MRVIAGTARGTRLQVPTGTDVRPTSDRARERLFAVLDPWLGDAVCLDLFAGSGALGIEALSRGARSCVFVERDARAAAVVRDNLARTGLDDSAEVYTRPAAAALATFAREGARFTLVLLDPPYADERVLQEVLRDLREMDLVAPDGLVAVEYPQGADPLPDDWEPGRILEFGASRIQLCRPRRPPG